MSPTPPPGERSKADPESPTNPTPAQVHDLVPLRTSTREWFKISLQTFGGPAGQIAVMQRSLVDEHRWIGERRFLHALSYCMLLPGPEAQQLAIYIGWLLNGTRGGLIAGTLFVLPGFVALLALSAIYVVFGDTAAVTALFTGLASAVLAIVAQAVIKVAKRALHHPALVTLAAAAFLALAVFDIHFPMVIAAAAIIGWALGRMRPDVMTAPTKKNVANDSEPLISDGDVHQTGPSWRRAAVILGLGVPLWLGPVAAAFVLTGAHSTFTQQGLFFTGTALVTFGGAYAVLAFVAQQAVENYGWLAPGEMVRGLALAETTPGPLIMVVQFVAFLGAFRAPGILDPWVAAILASVLTTWVTFVPGFLFILLGAPHVERLRGNQSVSSALTGITAAVVGVIANLALYFATHTLFAQTNDWSWGPINLDAPELASLQPSALLLMIAAMVMIFALRWSVLRTLGVCAVAGLGLGLLI